MQNSTGHLGDILIDLSGHFYQLSPRPIHAHSLGDILPVGTAGAAVSRSIVPVLNGFYPINFACNPSTLEKWDGQPKQDTWLTRKGCRIVGKYLVLLKRQASAAKRLKLGVSARNGHRVR